MILGEMVSLIFVRLGEMPETALTPTTARSLVASRPLSPAPSALPSATPMLAGPGASSGLFLSPFVLNGTLATGRLLTRALVSECSGARRRGNRQGLPQGF